MNIENEREIQQQAPSGVTEVGAVSEKLGRARIDRGTINCDQVAWILDIADRYIGRSPHPSISREREMKKYGMLYEIMEVMCVGFDNDAARQNGMPPDVREYKGL